MASLLRRKIVKAGSPRRIQKLLCSTSVQVSGGIKEEPATKTSKRRSRDELSIPMVPKRRDPDAVLKALASTVEPIEMPLYMRGRGIADPLYPRGRGYHMTYTKHLEAGKAAAQSIIQKWPNMFPSHPVDPSAAYDSLIGKSPLECLISEREASKAWNMYQTMEQDGEEVPLSLQNELLALVAYHGLDNSYALSQDERDIFVSWPRGNPAPDGRTTSSYGSQRTPEGRTTSSHSSQSTPEGKTTSSHGSHTYPEGRTTSSHSSQSTPEGKTTSSHGSHTYPEGKTTSSHGSQSTPEGKTTSSHSSQTSPGARTSNSEGDGGLEEELDIALDGTSKGSISIWSTDNVAEVMFRDMKKKDGDTYEAIIQGLIKYNRYGRAFDMFQEMRDKKFQASIETYNQLLSALKGYRVFNIAKNLVQHMNYKPIVQPNITTMNHLLRISSKLNESTKSLTLKIMRETFHLGLEPTLTTFVNLLMAHSSDRYGSTNEERAAILEQIVSYIEDNKRVMALREETDVIFFIQAFTTARKIGSADLSMRLKNLAAVHGNFLVDNINYVMGLYLSTLSQHAPIETTMSEYYSIVPKVLVPMEWVFKDLFEMCHKHKSPETALKLWKHSKRFMVPLLQVTTLSKLCGAFTHTIPAKDVLSYLEALNELWEIFQKSGNKPSELLITAMVRIHVWDNNLDEAWRYFKHFEDKPSFLALVTLLKKYNSLGDKSKTIEILEMMAGHEMTLPLRFVKDILWSSGASEETRHRLLDQLGSNRPSEEQQDREMEATGRQE